MTFFPYHPPTWNGPICPSCGRGYINTTTIQFTQPYQSYQPKHRKPGPAH